MKIIVKKFGGTSVETITKIREIANKLYTEMKPDYRYVIVVSAMGDTTNNLTSMAYDVSSSPCKRELDMLLTAGERISMSLLSIALQDFGVVSISFTGSQSGIITDSNHGDARITDVTAFRIREELKNNKVVIVAGFQGVSINKEVTTLGRGGSDTSAVAIAAYLEAQKCEIYTDVAGIYSADPRVVSDSFKLDELDYLSVLEMAYGGSQVIHPRAVEFAQKYNMPLEVKSSFTFQDGTLITKDCYMQENRITSLAHKIDLTRVVIRENSSVISAFLQERGIEFFDFSFDHHRTTILFEPGDVGELLIALKDFYISKLEIVHSITLIGNRVINDVSLLREIIATFSKLNCKIVNIKKNTIGITFIIKNDDIYDTINILHNKFIL